MTAKETVTISVEPTGGMDVLSQQEISQLKQTGEGGLQDLFTSCCLAVLNCGSHSDDPDEQARRFSDFRVRVIQRDRGIKLELDNPPEDAFVDGQIIEGIREMLFDVLRDIVYVNSRIRSRDFDLGHSDGITDSVFSILRHASVMLPRKDPNVVVCWGGHSISRFEYDYSKEVGYQLGLRGFDICTGCGPGAMKGPMKGAAVAHRKQRIHPTRYVGISEPGIIAAESPNPIVNKLIIMPDIEKRLEAFVRFGHGIIVFPGGVGTAEEILYLLGILLHPDNRQHHYPMILTGPERCRDYFQRIDEFIGLTLGEEAQSLYQIIVDDPVEVTRIMKSSVSQVREHRKSVKDAFFFNWSLNIEMDLQQPFEPTHENMAALDIHRDQEKHRLASNLRKVFSGIVAGNVKPNGIEQVRKHGKFQINGDKDIMESLDQLLASFVEQHRMKLPGTRYEPCYEVIT